MEIKIADRQIFIPPATGKCLSYRYHLQEYLLKASLSLVKFTPSAGQDGSATRSLATCLLQHALGCYSIFHDLSDAWYSTQHLKNARRIECKENDWIRFCLKIEELCKEEKQTTLELQEFQLREYLLQIKEAVINIFNEFDWFNLLPNMTFNVTCIVENQQINFDLFVPSFVSRHAMNHYICFDCETMTFHGLTTWMETFQDKEVFQVALVCQLAKNLKECFVNLLSERKPTDDELEVRSLIYLNKLNEKLDSTIKDHLKLIESWGATSDAGKGSKTMLNELLDPCFDNKRFDIALEVRQEFIKSLKNAYEELQILQRQTYEQERLKAIENKEEDEKQVRKHKKEIEVATKEIEKLQRKIDDKVMKLVKSQAKNEEISSTITTRYGDLWRCSIVKVIRSRKNSRTVSIASIAYADIEKKRELLKSKQDELEWNRFCVILSGLELTYDLVKMRYNHTIFAPNNVETADIMVTNILKELKLSELFLTQNGNLEYLKSYVNKNSSKVLAELIQILKKLLHEPLQNTTGHTWKFDGNAMILSYIRNQWNTKYFVSGETSGTKHCEEIIVNASRVIYVDCDWKVPGISLVLCAPLIKTIDLFHRYTIDTSGLDAPTDKPVKAKDGIDKGCNGDDGEHGQAGKSAGHILIKCDTFYGLPFHIRARGGNGACGQDGGDGQIGKDGQRGADGKLRSKEDVNQNFDYIPLTYNLRSCYDYIVGNKYQADYIVYGEPGRRGVNGGSGGSGGSGGQGGHGGEVSLKCESGPLGDSVIDKECGANGEDGEPGQGAKGGKGGQNGLDAARVFEPDDLNPWFWISGKWETAIGHLKLEEVYRTSDKYLLGYKIIVLTDLDKGMAQDGDAGDNGQNAEKRHQNKSVAKRALPDVTVSWNSDCSQNKLVMSPLQEQEAAVRSLGQAIVASDAAQRRAIAAAKQEADNEKKLKRAEESEQRVMEAFRTAETQSSSQLMRKTQQTHTIADNQPTTTGSSKQNNKPQNKVLAHTALVLAELKPTSIVERNDLRGVALLDALIAEHSHNIELSQTLSLLTQSLVLQIYLTNTEDQDKLWLSIVKVVNDSASKPNDLIQSLNILNKTIDLIQKLIAKNQEELLEQMLQLERRKSSNSFSTNQASKNVNDIDILSVLHTFHQLQWSYAELQMLLEPLENRKQVISSTDKMNEQSEIELDSEMSIIEFLVKELVTTVSETIKSNVLVQGDKEQQNIVLLSYEKKLHELLQISVRNNFMAWNFFDKLIEKFKGGKKKTMDELENIMVKFALKQLNVKNLFDLLPKDGFNAESSNIAINIVHHQKLTFLLERFKISIDNLDAIRSELEKRNVVDVEPFKTIYALTEQTFIKFYWSCEWKEIYDILDQLKETTEQRAEVSNNALPEYYILRESVIKLKAVLMWTYSDKSFKQKMNLCSTLKKKLTKNEWTDTVSTVTAKITMSEKSHLQKCKDWVNDQKIAVLGNSHHDHELFMSFIKQLQFIEKNSDMPCKQALYYLAHNKQLHLTASDVELLNIALDKKILDKIKNEPIFMDLSKIRAEYIRHWPERYFMRWADCWDKIDNLRQEVRKKWEDHVIHSPLSTVAEPKKTLRRINILLSKYAFLTTFFLSPSKCLEEWQSLKSNTIWTDLEQTIKSKAAQNFNQKIKKIGVEVYNTLDQLLKRIKTSVNQTSADEKFTPSFKICDDVNNCLSIVDNMVKIVESGLIGVQETVAYEVSELLSKVELLVMCLVEFDDSNAELSELVYSNIEKWKHSIILRNEKNGSRSLDDIPLSLAKVLNMITWSITANDSLRDCFDRRAQRNRRDVERAIKLQLAFTEHLRGILPDELNLINSTVRYWGDGNDFNPWNLGCHTRQYMPLLVETQFKIWIDITSQSNTFYSTTINCSSFFDELLATKFEFSTLVPRMAIATDLLIQHLENLVDLHELIKWSELIANITTVVKKEASSPSNASEITKHLLKLQAVLIAHFSVFQTRLINQQNQRDQLATKAKSSVIIDQLTTITCFIEENPVQRNQLFIKGFVLLADYLEKCTNSILHDSSLNTQQIFDVQLFFVNYIKPLINGKEFDKKHLKKKKVIDVVYSLSEEQNKQTRFTLTEKAFLERCIQSKALRQNNKSKSVTPQQITTLFNKINEIENCPTEYDKTHKSLTNRFVSLFNFEDVFNDEEKKYITIIGQKCCLDVFLVEQPGTYLTILKELSGNTIYQKIICHFYPEVNTEQELQDDVLKSYKRTRATKQPLHLPEKTKSCNPALKRRQEIVNFQRSFDRAYFFAKRNGTDFEWLLWLQETVLKSLATVRRDLMTLETLTELIESTAEFPLDQLFYSTSTSRPYLWIDDILVNSILKALSKLDKKIKTNVEEHTKMQWTLTAGLHNCLHASPDLNGRAILNMLLLKLEQEVHLMSKSGTADFALIVRLITDLQNVKKVDDVNRFQGTSLQHWPMLIRHMKLSQVWPNSLTNQLTTVLDKRLGRERTDRFLQQFNEKFKNDSFNSSNGINHLLEIIIGNLSKYPWTIDYFVTLASDSNFGNHEETERLWKLIQSAAMIEDDRKKISQAELNVGEILKIMKVDPDSKKIIGDEENQEKLLQQIEEIELKAKEIKDWKLNEIKEWSRNVKISKKILDPVEYLSVASLAVKMKNSCQLNKGKEIELRDTQMLAILIFVSSSSSVSSSRNEHSNFHRRMAQISTGEGKTLITALLVVYHVLSNWSNGCRSVDIITSSSVLAEANIVDVKWFYDIFDVSVENNCDAACSNDENLRRRRYNTDVIYGDLSSFQRDILLSRFFTDRPITCNREAGAIVVDEVDSMLLDKGENILYLSHKIPEMDDLLLVFVAIWSAVNHPLAAVGDEKAQVQILNFIKQRIEEGEIVVPKCLVSFVQRYLLAWIRNAYRAKNLLITKDTYKVDDIGDGRGQQIVIMDKETGVEQVQMQWSNGLHQFLQLKHALKLSPVSLKAVFMSNIGFFNQHKEAALYGMTGTLGSTAECQLLREVFAVDFFKMPRFKRRFCLEKDHFISSDKQQWLEHLVQATNNQLKCNRAVLIVCENIASAENALKKLKDACKNLECNLTQYISALDKEFQKKQLDDLKPKDVIVATNIAGRGTDFKISDSLKKNGGLHVIISYIPANARVESQIEGRVARAGQPGSFQFIIWNCNPNFAESDVALELSRLKVERDEQECRRLEHIRTHGLQKIFLEEELFERFHTEIYDKAKKSLQNNADAELQLNFLMNRWAMWLDENAPHIEAVQSMDIVKKNFNDFKSSCLFLANSTAETARFASTTSELLTLGAFYDNSGKPNDITNSLRCYEQVIKTEPKACEVALIHQTRLVLQNASEKIKKKQSKQLLMKAKSLILDKVSKLSAADILIKRTFEASVKSHGAATSENRFEEQITNLLSLLQVHIRAIDDILGRSVHKSIAMYFTNEAEAQALVDVITDNNKCKGLCKPYRLSKKVTVKKDVMRDEDELYISYGDSNQRMIEWPSELVQFKRSAIKLIESKRNALCSSFDKTILSELVVTQNLLWQALIDEKYVGNEDVHDKDVIRWKDRKLESDSDIEDFMQKLPRQLTSFKIVLLEWLLAHDGEEFVTAVLPLGIDTKQGKLLEMFLKTENIVNHLNEKWGTLLKTITVEEKSGGSPPCVIDLPASLKKYEFLLASWIMINVDKSKCNQSCFVKLAGEQVSREELPCPSNANESIQKLFNHLVSEAVIKEPALVFKHGLVATKENVDAYVKLVNESISVLTDVTNIFKEYRPPPSPLTTYSYFNQANYIIHRGYAGACDALNYINPFKQEHAIDASCNSNPENTIQWLIEKQELEHLESYRREIATVLINSLGQLKTISVITASFQPLSDYFKSEQSRTYPVEELHSFADKSFANVIKLTIARSWWDYWDTRAFCVALAGVIQIAAGVALTVSSFGLLTVVGQSLIAEGIGDIIFSIQSGLTGNFSWESYRSHKIFSLAMTVATAGLGAFLTKGVTAGRMAALGYQGKAGFSLCWAATKSALKKCGRAILSTLTSMGTEKLLDWLKKFVIDNILVYVKCLVSKVLGSLFDRLSEIVDKIWKIMKSMGRHATEIKNFINAQLDKAKSSELFTLWSRRLAGQATSVGSAIGRCFSESADVLCADGNIQLEQKPQGLDPMKKAYKAFGYAQKAMKIVSWVNNGSEIMGLITYGPEYVTNVERIVGAEASKLEADDQKHMDSKQHEEAAIKNQNLRNEESSIEDFSEREKVNKGDNLLYEVHNTASSIKTDEQVFSEYKTQLKEQITGDVLKYMVDNVTRAWVQPWLQSKIENLIIFASNKTFQCLGSLWQESLPDETNEEQKNNNDQANEDEATNAESENTAAEIVEKELDHSIGEGNTEKEKDSNGNTVVQAKTYADVIANVGNGQPAGLLQMQMVADAIGYTLEIVDETNEQDFKSETGTFEITPAGKSTGKIQLIYTSNEDGSKHVSLKGPDGKEIPLPATDTDAPPNRCLYEAVAGFLNRTTEQLLHDVKNHALTNKLTQFLYNQRVDEALFHMRVGARPARPEGGEQAVFSPPTEGANLETTITERNLNSGSETTYRARQANKETKEIDDHNGHLLGYRLGGGGGPENVVNMNKSLNMGLYKKMENDIVNLLKTHEGCKIKIQIFLNVGVDGAVNLRRPVNFKVVCTMTTAAGEVKRYETPKLNNDSTNSIGNRPLQEIT